MNLISKAQDLETFSELPEVPKCIDIGQGRKLLRILKERDSLISRARLTFILKALFLPDNGKVLEIGPGCCDYALEFCLRGFRYQGYDMVEENLRVWRILKSQFMLKGDIIIQDICTIETKGKEGYYDGIFSKSTFEHIHNVSRALDNW